MRLLFLSNVPSPYMVDFFNELGMKCDLTVIFEKKSSSERNKSWEKYKFITFKGIVLNGITTSVDAAFCPQVVKYINKVDYDFIIVTNPATPTGVTAIEYMKLRRIPFILESEGSFAKSGIGFKERFKKHLMSGAKLYFSTTPKADEYFLMYGATKEKIVKYPFTSLYESDILKSPLSHSEKSIKKDALGLKGERIVVAAGRFIPTKQYDFLIQGWSKVNKNYTLYIVGEGPERAKYEELIKQYGLSNVYLTGFMMKETLFDYYRSADLFIHPTSTDVWGLVINEAMACGLPVITTDMCIAGLELVKNGENGYIVSVGDEKELLEKISIILSDDELRAQMASRSIEKIRRFTFEEMAEVHIRVLKSLSGSLYD